MWKPFPIWRPESTGAVSGDVAAPLHRVRTTANQSITLLDLRTEATALFYCSSVARLSRAPHLPFERHSQKTHARPTGKPLPQGLGRFASGRDGALTGLTSGTETRRKALVLAASKIRGPFVAHQKIWSETRTRTLAQRTFLVLSGSDSGRLVCAQMTEMADLRLDVKSLTALVLERAATKRGAFCALVFLRTPKAEATGSNPVGCAIFLMT